MTKHPDDMPSPLKQVRDTWWRAVHRRQHPASAQLTDAERNTLPDRDQYYIAKAAEKRKRRAARPQGRS